MRLVLKGEQIAEKGVEADASNSHAFCMRLIVGALFMTNS